MLKEVIASGNFRVQNIIGKKMGLEHLDILAELSRRGFMHLLANILMKLSGMDLINLSKVSRIWKKILENNKGAVHLYSKTMQSLIESSKLSLHAATRGYVVGRAALTSVQKSSSTWAPPQKKDVQVKSSSQRGQKGSTYSWHNKFVEVADNEEQGKPQSLCLL